MKRYKLLRDLPNLKKGTILSETDPVLNMRVLTTKAKGVGISIISDELSKNFLEELQEEPTDSIHWEPLPGDIYWYLSNTGVVLKKQWMSSPDDIMRHVIGNTYRSEKECEKACNRKLVKARLRRTSNFEPDFLNDNGGWVVYYVPREKRLEVQEVYRLEYGELVRYETEEDARKSIKENREDWLTYFGIRKEKEE